MIIQQAANHQLIVSTTWTENLFTGLVNLIRHFLMPLNDFGFDFDCLFTTEPICKTIKTQTIDGFSKHTIGSGIRPTSVDNETYLGPIIHWLGSILRSQQHKSETKNSSPHWWSIVLSIQLVICTIILSYYLTRDMRIIVMRTRCYN